MVRLNQRLETAERAYRTLKAVGIASPLDPIDRRDIAIMRFIYTFEAVWKATRLFLGRIEGRDENAPKSCIRAAFEVGLLSATECEAALSMADDRNLAVHTYNERLAEVLFARLPGHVDLLGIWLAAMRQRIEKTRKQGLNQGGPPSV